MARWTYETMAQSLIPNTTMRKGYADGVHRIYEIEPNEQYVLHDKDLDEVEYDENGEPIRAIKLGYYPMYVSCGANYDFTPVTVTDENGVNHTAYGSREFFARPISTDNIPIE